MEIDPTLTRAVIAAFLDDGPERTYYYDRDTSRMVSVSEDQEDPANQRIVWQLESDTRGRFVPIPKPKLEETLDEQDAFVEQLPDSPLKSRLETLIESDPDGSRMAEVVIRDREARNAWRLFRTGRAEDQARTFLSGLSELD